MIYTYFSGGGGGGWGGGGGGGGGEMGSLMTSSAGPIQISKFPEPWSALFASVVHSKYLG